MAAIRACSSKILITCADSFILFDLRDEEKDLKVVKVPLIEEIQNEGDAQKKHSNTIKDENRILASAFSKSGKYFALADDRKYLHLYLSEECRLLWSRSVIRRGTSVTFTQDEKYVVLSDKSGDVYRYLIDQHTEEQKSTQQHQDEQKSTQLNQDEQNQTQLNQDEQKPTQLNQDELNQDELNQTQLKQDDQKQYGELLLGHLSMVLDLVLMKNDRYLVTCDKDEKVRISCYPNSYNIHSYCLGHTQFVNGLIYEEENDLLISGSGDCTIRLWDYNGEQQYCQQCKCLKSDSSDITKDAPYIKCMNYSPQHKLFAVGFGNNNCVEIYKLKTDMKGWSLELVQGINVEKDILSLVISDDKLYILQPIPDNFIIVYNITGDSGLEKLTLCTDEKTKQFANKMNSLKDFFSGCVNVECIYPNLRKSRNDNMAEYLQRKEKRIHGEKLEPPTYNEKKPKLS